MKTTIYVEGGGNASLLQSELRHGFKALFESAGFRGRLPRVVACGSRNDAFNDFKIALQSKTNERRCWLCAYLDAIGPALSKQRLLERSAQHDGTFA